MDKKTKKEQNISESVSDKDIDIDADKIMEETLKEIFDEVKDSDENSKSDSDKKEKKKNGKAEKKAHVHESRKVSEDKQDSERTKNSKKKVVKEESEDKKAEEIVEKDNNEEEDHEEIKEEIPVEEKVISEDLNTAKESENEEKKAKTKKIITGIAIGVLALICVVYFGGAYYFSSHFYLNTSINGTDFSRKTAKEVESYMEKQVADYVLSIEKYDGTVEKISGEDIELVYKESDELNKLIKEQNAFLWPKSIWEKSKIRANVGVEYNKEKLSEQIAGLESVKEENQVPPVAAHPEFDGNKFIVKEEQYGTQLDRNVFDKKVEGSIEKFEDKLVLFDEKCYVMPKYKKDDKIVIDASEEMNKYLPASITYVLGDNREVVDKNLISQWVTTNENMEVTFHSDQIKEFVKGLAGKYNTRGTQRRFVSGSGNTVSVKGGNYGWVLDQNAEVEYLEKAIANGTVETREPEFKQKAASHGSSDWGNTFVEIDLTNQKLYLFVNGSVKASGSIVTGKPSAGNATPQGVYSIKYCQRNAVLRGPKQPDGKYKWESPVSFWMPFNGGIGLHDANWQSSFGGNRYLTHGSHGCVNLPYSLAQTVFSSVHAGTPVVCHY